MHRDSGVKGTVLRGSELLEMVEMVGIHLGKLDSTPETREVNRQTLEDYREGSRVHSFPVLTVLVSVLRTPLGLPHLGLLETRGEEVTDFRFREVHPVNLVEDCQELLRLVVLSAQALHILEILDCRREQGRDFRDPVGDRKVQPRRNEEVLNSLVLVEALDVDHNRDLDLKVGPILRRSLLLTGSVQKIGLRLRLLDLLRRPSRLVIQDPSRVPVPVPVPVSVCV